MNKKNNPDESVGILKRLFLGLILFLTVVIGGIKVVNSYRSNEGPTSGKPREAMEAPQYNGQFDPNLHKHLEEIMTRGIERGEALDDGKEVSNEIPDLLAELLKDQGKDKRAKAKEEEHENRE